jgi:hypothetical protein
MRPQRLSFWKYVTPAAASFCSIFTAGSGNHRARALFPADFVRNKTPPNSEGIKHSHSTTPALNQGLTTISRGTREHCPMKNSSADVWENIQPIRSLMVP